MGWNILPSTPVRKRIGANTMRIMIWPKKDIEYYLLPTKNSVKKKLEKKIDKNWREISILLVF